MEPSSSSQTSELPTSPLIAKGLHQAFRDNGYLKFEGVVDKAQLTELTTAIRREFEETKLAGRLFEGGGTLSGHLNCFPGAGSRFVYEALEAAGIIALVRSLSAVPLRAPNIGCNLNLPGSSAQNDHVDGYASQPFLVVNVAAVDTDLDNGAMEILVETHHSDSKYWQILLERPKRKRVCLKQGDVVIRTSTLWHRGMPNFTALPRPMLAFTWEDGGSSLADPYQVHDGHITFLPNRYQTDWASRLRERAFVTLPAAGTAYRAVRSFF